MIIFVLSEKRITQMFKPYIQYHKYLTFKKRCTFLCLFLCFSFLAIAQKKGSKVQEGAYKNPQEVMYDVFEKDYLQYKNQHPKDFQQKPDFFKSLRENTIKYNVFFEDQDLEQEKDKDLVGYIWAVRANLLHWLTLTPDLGIEYRHNGSLHQRFGILAHGAWTDWKVFGLHIALWKINPEFRYYYDKKKQAYVGLSYSYINYLFGAIETGIMGGIHTASITGGYQVRLGHKSNFYMDFNLGLGYGHGVTNTYGGDIENNIPLVKNYLGLTQIGISLVWAFKTEKVK